MTAASGAPGPHSRHNRGSRQGIGSSQRSRRRGLAMLLFEKARFGGLQLTIEVRLMTGAM